jgi:hypothetical protein
MSENRQEPQQPEIEFVGSPTEFANAQEVPEWVANIARFIVFLPAAWVTATTIPIILFAMFGVLMLCACMVLSLVF